MFGPKRKNCPRIEASTALEVLRLLVAEQAEQSGKRGLLHLIGFTVLQGSPFVPYGGLIAMEQMSCVSAISWNLVHYQMVAIGRSAAEKGGGKGSAAGSQRDRRAICNPTGEHRSAKGLGS